MSLIVTIKAEGPAGPWIVRIHPEVPSRLWSVMRSGESRVRREPDYQRLDRLMLASRAGYVVRTEPDGSTTIAATTEDAEAALCDWLSELFASVAG